MGPFLNVKFGHVEGDASFDDGAMPIEDYYLNGDYVGTYGIRMGAVTWDNGIQLELIEPMENRSLFRQYLDSHGPGPQHIAVSSPLPFQEDTGGHGGSRKSPGLDGKGGPGGGLLLLSATSPLGRIWRSSTVRRTTNCRRGSPLSCFLTGENVPAPLLSRLTGITFGVR